MTIKNLINSNGRPLTGLLDEAVEHINYLDYDLRTVMDRRRSRLARRWGFNQFQFISVQAPGWVFGLALVDLKLVGNGFFYLYDFESGTLREQSFLQPLAIGTRIEPAPEQGVASFSKGDLSINITPGVGGRNVSVSGPGGIEVDLELKDDLDPLRLVSPAGYNGWVFTRKSAGLPVDGEIRWGQDIWRCDESSRGSIDWSCGFMRRETAWNWACIAGKLASGHSLGLNLASGVNETGVTENALWINGRCIKLGAARFSFDRYQPEKDWAVTTDDGRVDLRFTPSGVRKERLNALILASNFRQFIGTFEGQVVDDSGQVIPVKGVRGLMEDHFARW
ncbi:DUF2804 domain-containing protein [Marinobacter salinexigens]|uniref:DUF2804 domain-containing protein n=1 Tax=Marinobacter salinexigens TaxID=2919747 RepID=A0A5B0VDB7_9GAMM|nr:DUF2804 domain-containing protein [Marinobacter salinexigens]KAA1172051.1 DUF2804 domain-containing protein [Marinobacter salinexigens]